MKKIIILFAILALVGCFNEEKEPRMLKHIGDHVYVEPKQIGRVPTGVIHAKMNCSHIEKNGVHVYDTKDFRAERVKDECVCIVLDFCSNCFNQELYDEFKDYEIPDSINK